MRRLTSLIAESFARRQFPAPEPSEGALAHVPKQVNRVLRRRLADRVTDLFRELCVGGDLQTAEELLEVLEAIHRRRQAAMPDRRIGNAEIVQARKLLIECKAQRKTAPVDPAATALDA